jgi:hypothetical protein
VISSEPWADYQRQVVGPKEVKLGKGDDVIWADGLDVDPDTVVVAEAKRVKNAGSGMYEGKVPPKILDRLFRGFDDEMRRYGELLKDADNPIGRLRIIASTQAAASYLEARARSILGPQADLQVRYTPEKGHP